ncbi:hypothetical protein [Streptomyces sp. NPDC059278]|uniref:hypothetical protein n=1 Tax=Streptomyces sp. NPDC059278 TaxID=3346801 RepID=UPI0036A17C96
MAHHPERRPPAEPCDEALNWPLGFSDPRWKLIDQRARELGWWTKTELTGSGPGGRPVLRWVAVESGTPDAIPDLNRVLSEQWSWVRALPEQAGSATDPR